MPGEGVGEVGREELSALPLWVSVTNCSLELCANEGDADVVSGLLQPPLPRRDPSTALGLPPALQMGDRSLGTRSRELIHE